MVWQIREFQSHCFSDKLVKYLSANFADESRNPLNINGYFKIYYTGRNWLLSTRYNHFLWGGPDNGSYRLLESAKNKARNHCKEKFKLVVEPADFLKWIPSKLYYKNIFLIERKPFYLSHSNYYLYKNGTFVHKFNSLIGAKTHADQVIW